MVRTPWYAEPAWKFSAIHAIVSLVLALLAFLNDHLWVIPILFLLTAFHLVQAIRRRPNYQQSHPVIDSQDNQSPAITDPKNS